MVEEGTDRGDKVDRKTIEDAEVLIKSVEIDINEAEKTGADLTEARRFLEEARTTLRNRDIKGVKITVKMAKTAAADSKRYHRAELLIKHALPVVESVKKAGADASIAESCIDKAREALQTRMYGELSEHVRAAKKAAKEAKSYHRAYLMIENCKTDIANAKSAGADVTEAESFLEQAATALENMEYGVVSQLVKNAKNAAVSLQKHQQVEELIAGVKPDVEELKRLGVRTEDMEELILKAEEALERHDYAEVRSLVRNIKRRVKRAMERKGAGVLIATIEHVMHKAHAKGLDVTQAKALLDRAGEALDKMNHEELERIISETKSLARTLEVPIGTLAGELFSKAKLVDLDKIDLVFSEAERKISLEMAKAKIIAMHDLMTSAKELGIEEAEFFSLLKKAEEAFAAKDFDVIEEYKDAFDEKLDDEKMKHRTEFIWARIKKVMTLLSQFKELGIVVDKPEELLVLAEKELNEHNFEKAEDDTGQAEKIANELRKTHDIDGDLSSIRDTILEAKECGVDITEANELLSQAENELNAENFDRAMELIEEARTKISANVEQYIHGKFPKLTLKLPEGGVEADIWNKCIIEIANIGDIIARNVELKFEGDTEVKGVDSIAKLGVGEKRSMEIGIKPKEAGELSLEVLLAYQRAFDDKIYQLDVVKKIIVDASGTFLVEDVFLIHNSGTLVSKVSRLLEEDIDKDIFSGMLTAVQEFIKDSFRQREEVGLKRMDFGTHKILIEHGQYAFLTTIILGGEPRYLPLYMLEVLREVEEKYGSVLDGWRGTFTELEGVDDLIGRLLQVTEEKGADVEGFESGAITSTIKLIEAAREAGANIRGPEAFAKELIETLETQGLENAWGYLESTGKEAEREMSAEPVRAKITAMQGLMSSAKELGLDETEFLSLIEKAREAFEREEFEVIDQFKQEFEAKLDEAKLELKTENIGERIKNTLLVISKFKELGLDVGKPEELLMLAEKDVEERNFEGAEKIMDQAEKLADVLHRRYDYMREIESLRKLVADAKTSGIDVDDADGLLDNAENEINTDNFAQALELMETVKKIAASQRKKYDAELEMESVRKMIADAKALGIDVEEANALIGQAENDLETDNFDQAKDLIERVKTNTSTAIKQFIKDKFPRLTVKLPEGGMEANTWNKCSIELANIGEIMARNLDLTFQGDVDIKGVERVEKLGIGDKHKMDIGVKPTKAGELDVDVLLTYQRAFDDTIYQLDVTKKLSVDSSGTFLVEDVFLIHNSGLLVTKVTRKLDEDVDREIFSGMLTAVQEFIKDSFRKSERGGLNRMDFGTHKILIEHGQYTFLATVLLGGEPEFLPLFMLEVIKEVEQKYGSFLDKWDGSYSKLEGLEDIVRKLLQVTDEKGTDVEGFEVGTVASTIKLIEAAKEAGVELGGPGTFAKEVIETLEKEGFEHAWDYLEKTGKEVEQSSKELKVKREGIEELKHTYLSGMDEHLIMDIGDSLENYLVILDNVIEIVAKTRQENDLKATTPLKNVAIKSPDETVRDAVTKLRIPFLDKVNAKNLDIVEPGKEWQGLNLEIIPDRDLIIRAYKQQASKVESLIKYQSPWKIKDAIEKSGEYTIGVEGYPVKITSNMLSFKLITPENVVVKEFNGGTIYIDKEVTEEIKVEGIAEEVIEHINSVRKELNLTEDNYIETQIVAEDKTVELLETWKDYIKSKTKSYAVEFPFENIFESGDSGYYVTEKEIHGEKLIIGVVVVEWDEG